MKKRIVRVLALLFCILLCFALAGCGSNVETMLLANRCVKALAEVESLCFDAAAVGTVSLAGERFRLQAAGEGDWMAAPFGLRMDTIAALGDFLTVEAPVLLVTEEEKLCVYVGLSLGDEPMWIRIPLGEETIPVVQDFSGILRLLSGNGELVVRDESLENGENVCLRVTVPGVLLSEGAEDLPVTVWLDRQSSLPVHLEADLSAAVRSALERSDDAARRGITVESLQLELAISAVNSAERIEAPDANRVMDGRPVEAGAVTEAFTAAGETRAA